MPIIHHDCHLPQDFGEGLNVVAGRSTLLQFATPPGIRVTHLAAELIKGRRRFEGVVEGRWGRLHSGRAGGSFR